MQNVEIKCPLEDRAAVEERLEALGAEEVWTRRQRDTFFRVPDGWLKLREAPDTEGVAPELIAYRRSTDTADARPSNYERAPVDDARRWLTLLGHVLQRETVVEKTRTLWRYEHTRVHLDRVEGLGEFLELETVLDGIDMGAGQAENRVVIDALALEPARFLARPYKEMLEGALA